MPFQKKQKQQAPVETSEPKGVMVKSAHEGRVGLWDVNPAHEQIDARHKDGEIFVKDEPVRVALTSEVAAAIKAGNLVETGERREE